MVHGYLRTPYQLIPVCRRVWNTSTAEGAGKTEHGAWGIGAGGGIYIQKPGPLNSGLDARLTTLLCERITVAQSKIKTASGQTERYKDGYGF
jgi:hypothetical protein